MTKRVKNSTYDTTLLERERENVKRGADAPLRHPDERCLVNVTFR